MKNMVDVTCKFCGKIFQVHPYRAETASYCSYSCRSKAPKTKNRKITKICEHCGKTYETFPCFSASRYCSNDCAHAEHGVKVSGSKSSSWKGGKKTIKCAYCGEEFLVHPGNTTRKFCSKKCHDEIRLRRVSLVCANCGKQYEDKLSRANRYAHSFCSPKCRYTFLVGKKSPHWQDVPKTYPETWNRKFKQMIRERDNYTCAICKEYGNEVHHINYVKNDTVPENCITLCHSCHSKTRVNRPYWLAFFSR